MFNGNHIAERPPSDYINAVQRVIAATGEVPPDIVFVQRVDNLLMPEEIWVQPGPDRIPHNMFGPQSLAPLDFVCGAEWNSSEVGRMNTATVRINAKDALIEVQNNAHSDGICAVGLTSAGYNFHKISKNKRTFYLTANHEDELVTLLRLLLAP